MCNSTHPEKMCAHCNFSLVQHGVETCYSPQHSKRLHLGGSIERNSLYRCIVITKATLIDQVFMVCFALSIQILTTDQVTWMSCRRYRVYWRSIAAWAGFAALWNCFCSILHWLWVQLNWIHRNVGRLSLFHLPRNMCRLSPPYVCATVSVRYNGIWVADSAI